MGNFFSRRSGARNATTSSSSCKGEGVTRGQNGNLGGFGLEACQKGLVATQDGCSMERPLPFASTPFLKSEEDELHRVRASNRKVEGAWATALVSLPAGKEKAQAKKPLDEELEVHIVEHDTRLGNLVSSVNLAEEKLHFGFAPTTEKDHHGPFTPLTEEEEDAIFRALGDGSSDEVLARHEASSIEITRKILWCLKSGSWLNDEVINLYLDLLKERERRHPGRFLKCHFFNTFFYKKEEEPIDYVHTWHRMWKLTSTNDGYDFTAVRRWTSQKKLGYTLLECDKIFIPIHKGNHWCLAVANVKLKSFQYLDSLGRADKDFIGVLVTYLMDEVKDKNDLQIEAGSWTQESVHNLPQQTNEWDCGMFMLKYIDFYSRGLNLCFSQEHMDYFRKRTVKEILRLKAE